jgi:hypothetical protein
MKANTACGFTQKEQRSMLRGEGDLLLSNPGTSVQTLRISSEKSEKKANRMAEFVLLEGSRAATSVHVLNYIRMRGPSLLNWSP